MSYIINKDLLLDEMRLGIDNVLNGINDKYENEFLSPKIVCEYLDSIKDIKDLDRFESNGWNWDAWFYYEYNNKEFILSCNGYNGGILFKIEN